MDISKIRKVRAVVNLRTDKKLYPIGTLFEAPFSPDIEAEIRSGSNTLQVEETVSGPASSASSATQAPVQPEPAKRRGRKAGTGKAEETSSQITVPDAGNGAHVGPGDDGAGAALDPGEEI